jgi:hypothetical protein
MMSEFVPPAGKSTFHTESTEAALRATELANGASSEAR